MNRSDLVSLAIGAILAGATTFAAVGLPAAAQTGPTAAASACGTPGAATATQPAAAASACGGVSGCGTPAGVDDGVPGS